MATPRKPGAKKGGRRAGSGRKSYPPDVEAYLRTVEATRAITDAIRASAGYREWAIETGRLVVGSKGGA